MASLPLLSWPFPPLRSERVLSFFFCERRYLFNIRARRVPPLGGTVFPSLYWKAKFSSFFNLEFGARTFFFFLDYLWHANFQTVNSNLSPQGRLSFPAEGLDDSLAAIFMVPFLGLREILPPPHSSLSSNFFLKATDMRLLARVQCLFSLQVIIRFPQKVPLLPRGRPPPFLPPRPQESQTRSFPLPAPSFE